MIPRLNVAGNYGYAPRNGSDIIANTADTEFGSADRLPSVTPSLRPI
jgi:hypothetical protein